MNYFSMQLAKKHVNATLIFDRFLLFGLFQQVTQNMDYEKQN